MVADDRSNPRNWLGAYADADTGWLALRAAERPAYLASAFAEYLDLREWTPEQLAERLRCAPQLLARLGICRRPDPASLEFHQQVSQIVTRFEIDYWSLRRLLEELALPVDRRAQLWREQEIAGRDRDMFDSFASPRMNEAFGSPGDITQDVTQPDPRTLEQSRQGHRRPSIHMASRRMSSPMPASVNLPKTASVPPQSWIGRVFSRIRRFFSQK